MHGNIPERDWKIWRSLADEALNRFCQKIMEEAAEFADSEGSAHERYIQMYQHVKKRDRHVGEVFDGLSRSRAYLQIALAVRKRIVKREELSRFSEETQEIIASMLRGG